MIAKGMLFIIWAVTILLACQGVGDGQVTGIMQMKDETPIASDIFAAFLVAYEEHVKWWKSRGIDLTPSELKARHWAVHYAQVSPGRVSVLFLPESPSMRGGGVGYIVDLKSLRVIETFFER